MKLEYADISAMLEVAVVAARLAGQRAMEDISYVSSEIKNGKEMVTASDAICQKIIIDRVKESYPDHGFIGEEGSGGQMLKQPPRGSDEIWWVIDPIDGTNNYAHGLLGFSVSVAVMHEGRPVVGVIFDPATESMFTAAGEDNSQLNYSTIHTSDEDFNEFSSFAVDNHIEPDAWPKVTEIMKRCRFRNLGTTALHLAYVAKGSLVGAMTTMPRLWDFAAGALIIQNAGGVMTDLQGGGLFPVDLANYDGSSFRILGANKNVHPKIIEMLK